MTAKTPADPSGEWTTVPLREVAAFGSGTTPSRARQEEYFTSGRHLWVKTLDLNNSEITTTDERVTDRALKETTLRVHPAGAVLVAMYGGYQQIGRTGLLAAPAAVNQAITAVLVNRRVLDPGYLLHTLNHRVGYWRSVASSSRKDPNITSGDVKDFPISFPPLAEQRAIARAVADAGRLVVLLERTIAKKEAIKQGMMQRLLTGRRRLPGFAGEWRETALDELVQIVGGGTPKSSAPGYWDGGIAWCTPTDITRERSRYLRVTERTISRQGLEKSAAQLLPPGSLLLCTRATIGEVKIAQGPVTTNQGFKALVPKPGVSSEFLYYRMLALKEQLTGLGTGSTFLEVSKRDLAAVRLAVPHADEQKAVAAALMDADDEIDALRIRLAKAEAVKQGTMQELLTGRTRLPA
ncbi:restriction endonuclease subunit S [Streptomyces katsurahamanus]|uniref:Type I restriction modification DNA specificity domain-containing protein n=1 Tax=Streptomyces katsurahamanus TaxID=2577098 RepID=A0ABW9P0B9_9ACTN|nr:restriction endonuclease subunit S [Streptomyces katsurahamanus]MQS38965.1 hypothetical protein [Streptomyces katsurahamanus]